MAPNILITFVTLALVASSLVAGFGLRRKRIREDERRRRTVQNLRI